MKFKELDIVRICRDYDEQVKKGDRGTIVMVYDDPNEAYEVEFLDEEGYTKGEGTFTLLPDELEKADIV